MLQGFILFLFNILVDISTIMVKIFALFLLYASHLE